MIGQDRDEQVAFQAAVQAVIHRSEVRFALEVPEGLLNLGEHNIKGPEFLIVQVLAVGT